MTGRAIEITYTHAPFSNGHRIAVTTGEGSVQVGVSRQYDALKADYRAGSPVLVDEAGLHVCGPVDLDGARELARAALSGDPRALTEPQATLSLALALFHVLDTLDFVGAMNLLGQEEEPADEQEVDHG